MKSGEMSLQIFYRKFVWDEFLSVSEQLSLYSQWKADLAPHEHILSEHVVKASDSYAFPFQRLSHR
jgi:hypothetical protein